MYTLRLRIVDIGLEGLVSQRTTSMEDLTIERTDKTPFVEFLALDCKLTLSGRSIPENSIQFYQPLLDWTESFCAAGASSLEIHIKLEYFNTSSSKCLMDLLNRVEQCRCKAQVFWYYETEDEDMLEAGEDYSAIIQIPFVLVEMDGTA